MYVNPAMITLSFIKHLDVAYMKMLSTGSTLVNLAY